MASVAPPASGDKPVRPDLSGETHILDRLSILYKYRYAGIAVFLAVVGWSMVDSYTTIPLYRAKAQILIEEEAPSLGTPAEIAQSYYVPDPEIYFNTQYRILRGRELGRRVVQKLNLASVPEFNGQGPKPTPLARAIQQVKQVAWWPVRAVLGGGTPPVPSEPPSPNESASETPFIDGFLSKVQVEPVRFSRLVDVYFTSSDPAFAARAVNTLADEYVTQNLEVKLAALEKSLEWIAGEVERQQQVVQASERALAEYREQQDAGALADNQNIVVTRLNQLNDAVTQARTLRIQKEAIYNQVQQAGANRDTLSVILSNAQVQSLKERLTELQREQTRLAERYGEKHPQLQKVIGQLEDAERQYNEAVQKAAQNARAEYEAALAQERSLVRELEVQKAAATSLNRKNIDYTVLQREAETNRQIYNSLLQRERELRVIANSRANNVRVVDRAEPPEAPFTPNHRQDWMYALLFGVVLAFTTCFGLDYLDDTVKTPEDVTRRLKLRFLGLVPSVRGDRHPLLSGPVPHDFGEAFRTLRTSLVAQHGGDGPKVIAITSAQPLEGKTTTATNLAMALAVGGARVLLIDADMRRPSVHKALRINNDRGLSQLLAGQVRMREVVHRSHDPNLLVMTAGRTPSNPSELLASDRMRALINGLEDGPFDWVIIDTPPVLAVTDAVIVAPLVAGITFVIGSEMTRWRLAERAVEMVMQANPRSVSAVLNKVDFQRNKYYYSRYYGHQYKSYYQEAPAA
ncbi:MAG: polysaccharide biosynthesis tyrosine autokinase [Acidobacteriota bacterium]